MSLAVADGMSEMDRFWCAIHNALRARRLLCGANVCNAVASRVARATASKKSEILANLPRATIVKMVERKR